MKNPEVTRILNADRWVLARGELDVGPYLLRFREGLSSVADTSGYTRLLTIVWPYDDEGSGTLPSPSDLAALEQFEDGLCNAFEQDGHAIVTAVLTLDGARQWVVYADDISGCGHRIASMPQNEDPYPIELHARDDPEWTYLRDQILSVVD